MWYHNTIAGSSPSERIFIYFEQIRFASQKIEFLNFCFLAKKSIKMTLNILEINFFLHKLIYSILFFRLHNFLVLRFSFLELFLDEHAMALRYVLHI